MLTIAFILVCLLFSNIFSQLIPHRFDQAIDRLNQYRNYSPEDFLREDPFEYVLHSNRNNKTNLCEEQWDLILQSAMKSELWAVNILDAWGKPIPSGVVRGNIYWVGDYNECLEPMYFPANQSYITKPFDTQHCTVTPKAPQRQTTSMPSIILGVCLPSSCTHEDVVSLIHKLFIKVNVTVDNLACSTDPPNGQESLTTGAVVTIVILSILGLVVLIGTILDLSLRTKIDSHDGITTNINSYDPIAEENRVQHAHTRFSIQTMIPATSLTIFLTEFSARKTLRRVFTLEQKNTTSDVYLFLNGIRVLSLFFVIIGHSLTFGLSFTMNVVDVLAWTRNLAFQLFISADLCVDTFFVLSGFLTTILFVREMKKFRGLSFRLMFFYYLHRYIRLTPTFLLLVLVSINLTPYFGQGPIYPTQQGFEPSLCREQYWWTSILYVGNLVEPDNMCLGVAWYLHNDMQFHWIAPLFLIPFALRKKTFAYVLTIVLTLVGIGSIAAILLYYPDMSLNSITAFATGPGVTFFKAVYVTPWCRISAYTVGVLTAFCVIDVGRLYRMGRHLRYFISIFMIIIGLLCIFGTYPDYILPNGLNRSILVLYQSLSRTCWALCIGWMIFLCCINQGGIINRFLSWSIWSPLAKLNYSCYLIHSIVLNVIFLVEKYQFIMMDIVL